MSKRFIFAMQHTLRRNRRISLCQSKVAKLTCRNESPFRLLHSGAVRRFSNQPSLIEYISQSIKMSGPITVAKYMQLVLTNPSSGYYMNKDVFGEKGDFITSPEVSQMFGELVGVWCVNEWMNAGKPSAVNVVELGPGRGTLAQDMLRVFSQFPEFESVAQVRLVEISPHLSEIQASKLCEGQTDRSTQEPDLCYMSGKTEKGISVTWYKRTNQLPPGFSIYVAHEFLDALPIHKFQRTKHGWREVMIDIKTDSDPAQLCFVLAPAETPASKLLLRDVDYPGDELEICSEAGAHLQNLCLRMKQDGGSALIADYGHLGEKQDTFRAFRQHQLHDPLSAPGSADLTADVDFSYLTRCAQQVDATVHGPVNQANFLWNMGIGHRLRTLLQKASKEQRKQLLSGFEMITSEEKMGSRFKFLSVRHGNCWARDYVPAGFKPLV